MKKLKVTSYLQGKAGILDSKIAWGHHTRRIEQYSSVLCEQQYWGTLPWAPAQHFLLLHHHNSNFLQLLCVPYHNTAHFPTSPPQLVRIGASLSGQIKRCWSSPGTPFAKPISLQWRLVKHLLFQCCEGDCWLLLLWGKKEKCQPDPAFPPSSAPLALHMMGGFPCICRNLVRPQYLCQNVISIS